jgi:hypothetical protein
VGNENISLFVDSWTVAWSLALLLGYLAEMTPWARLAALRSPKAIHAMILSSAAVVLGLILGERAEAGAVVAAWAIVMSSVKLLYDALELE